MDRFVYDVIVILAGIKCYIWWALLLNGFIQKKDIGEHMPHIALKDAQLCLDCNMIGSDPSGCVVCCSKAVFPLAKFIDRIPTSGTRTVLEVDKLMQMAYPGWVTP